MADAAHGVCERDPDVKARKIALVIVRGMVRTSCGKMTWWLLTADWMIRLPTAMFHNVVQAFGPLA